MSYIVGGGEYHMPSGKWDTSKVITPIPTWIHLLRLPSVRPFSPPPSPPLPSPPSTSQAPAGLLIRTALL